MAQQGTSNARCWHPAESGRRPELRGWRRVQRRVCAVHSLPKHDRQRSSSPLGCHSMVWVPSWSPEEAELAISGTKRAGYDLIEIDLTQPDSVDPVTTRRLLDKYELSCSGSVGLPRAADISSSDSSVRNAGRKRLSSALKRVKELGGSYFGGVNYCAMDKYTYPCSLQQWNTCRDSLKELAKEAADYNIVWGLEVVNRYITNILNTAQQAMEMIADVNEENLVVHLDTLHMNIEESNLERACRLCGDRLGYVHAGESHWGYLGTGSVRWNSFFAGLAAIDYSGPITFESFSSAIASETHTHNLCIWRELWNDPEDLAIQAHKFLDANVSAAYAAFP